MPQKQSKPRPLRDASYITGQFLHPNGGEIVKG
jgi:hypothetical protein